MRELEQVAYADGDAKLTGLLARPDGAPRAAIVVFPTIMNSTDWVEDKARDLAAHGYLAMVADFYACQPAGREEAMECAKAIRQPVDKYRRRLRASLQTLAGLEDADGLPMAAIGFCMGGQAALEMAREGADLIAVVSFHGILATDKAAGPDAVKARLLVCHGDADPLVPRDAVMTFWEEMDHARANWHFHSYSGVRHAFANPEAEGDVTAYDASANRQSWAAMYSLFDEILG